MKCQKTFEYSFSINIVLCVKKSTVYCYILLLINEIDIPMSPYTSILLLNCNTIEGRSINLPNNIKKSSFTGFYCIMKAR